MFRHLPLPGSPAEKLQAWANRWKENTVSFQQQFFEVKSLTAIAGHVQGIRCYAEMLVWCTGSVEQRKMSVQDNSTLFYA